MKKKSQVTVKQLPKIEPVVQPEPAKKIQAVKDPHKVIVQAAFRALRYLDAISWNSAYSEATKLEVQALAKALEGETEEVPF